MKQYHYHAIVFMPDGKTGHMDGIVVINESFEWTSEGLNELKVIIRERVKVPEEVPVSITSLTKL